MIEGVTIFDFEVTEHDWILVAKNLDDGTYVCLHNDTEALRAFMETDPWLCGFNVKHYDNHIMKGCLAGFPPEMIKVINDRIILQGMNGWDVPELQDVRYYFDTIDLMDDTQLGTSLKSFEAHMGMSIQETRIGFDLPRAMTPLETQIMLDYCRADVKATEVLFYVRLPYLENKITLGEKCGLTPREALKLTNAKLTAKYLKAVKPDKPYGDERQYKFPGNLLKQYIPQEVFDYFFRMYDKNLSDEEVYGQKLNITVGECPVTIGYGGIHGAVLNYVEETTADRSIRNKDVASYYPNLVRHMGYASRNMPDPKIYADTIDERVRAKKAKDSTTANALKLVLNTTYGAMGNQYNELYDPLMMRSVCITGQLFLLELSEHLLAECPTLKIVQLNTDGIMVSFDNSDEAKWQEITQEWQDRTGFELEEDKIQKIIQKDVNNYVEIQKGSDGSFSFKLKGGKLVRGVLTNGKVDFKSMGFSNWENLQGGAFKINNDACVIPRAVVEYFVHGTPIEETVNASDNIFDFQLISKAGGKYERCFSTYENSEYPVQKVNRVYATMDERYGTIYKIHGTTGRPAKVGGLPEHCLIDNDNHCVIDMVDREWYTKQARDTINMFLGVKPPKVNKRKINSLVRKCMKILEEI